MIATGAQADPLLHRNDESVERALNAIGLAD
jgi:hypothetical protein